MFCFSNLKQEVMSCLAGVSVMLFCRLECFQNSSQKQQQQQAARKLASYFIAFIPTYSDFIDSSEIYQVFIAAAGGCFHFTGD